MRGNGTVEFIPAMPRIAFNSRQLSGSAMEYALLVHRASRANGGTKETMYQATLTLGIGGQTRLASAASNTPSINGEVSSERGDASIARRLVVSDREVKVRGETEEESSSALLGACETCAENRVASLVWRRVRPGLQ